MEESGGGVLSSRVQRARSLFEPAGVKSHQASVLRETVVGCSYVKREEEEEESGESEEEGESSEDGTEEVPSTDAALVKERGGQRSERERVEASAVGGGEKAVVPRRVVRLRSVPTEEEWYDEGGGGEEGDGLDDSGAEEKGEEEDKVSTTSALLVRHQAALEERVAAAKSGRNSGGERLISPNEMMLPVRHSRGLSRLFFLTRRRRRRYQQNGSPPQSRSSFMAPRSIACVICMDCVHFPAKLPCGDLVCLECLGSHTPLSQCPSCNYDFTQLQSTAATLSNMALTPDAARRLERDRLEYLNHRITPYRSISRKKRSDAKSIHGWARLNPTRLFRIKRKSRLN